MNYEVMKPSKEEIKRQIGPQDGFARTFIAKCDMMDKWDYCIGIKTLGESELLSIIVTTHSKTSPKTANLQLIHTFAKYRAKGHGSFLCKESVLNAYAANCKYFRVSAEESAVGFYRSIGFKFVGRQKSGCYLSIFPLTSPKIEENKLVLDSVIEKALYSKRKGGCVQIFKEVFNNDNSN